MGRTTAQRRCRICSFHRWHLVTLKRKNDALYTTSFYACSGCSVMFLNPEQFSASNDGSRYRTSLGRLPVGHLFQAPLALDADMTFFASTQSSGLWSYRNREEGGGWQWNAED